MDRKIIQLEGEEAEILRAAEQADLEAVRRIQSETPSDRIAPMVFYETEREQSLMKAKMELEKKYQQQYGLVIPPMLTACPVPVQGQQFSLDSIVRAGCSKAPSDMELAKLLLLRIRLKRCGQVVYMYNGKYYERLSDNAFHTEIVRYLREELSISGSSRQIKTVAEAILTEPTINMPSDQGDPNLICMQNGILDIRNFQLMPFSDRFFITWQMQAAWDPSAVCPCFDQFLYQTTGGDTMLLNRFWEVIGYILSPDNRAKRFFIFQGCGDSGKSVLGNLLRSFYDPVDVGSVDIFKMGDRFSLSAMASKRINVAMDLTDTSLTEQAVSVIKSITGLDLVSVEAKYKDPYATVISCKLIFGTNHRLRVNSIDPAFARRVCLLPFQYPVPRNQQDRNLLNRLLPERPAILYKAMCAYRQLVSNGYIFSGDDVLQFQSVPQSGDVVADSITTLESFAENCCYSDGDGFVTTDALHGAYLAYCQTQGTEGISNKQIYSAKIGPILLSRYMADKAKKRVDGVPCNGYRGIRVMSV